MRINPSCLPESVSTSSRTVKLAIVDLPIIVKSTFVKMVKVAIIYYSMYGHVATLAEAEKKGVEAAGGQADIYQ